MPDIGLEPAAELAGEPCADDPASLAERFPRLWSKFGNRDEA
jgi:hypothetical protein